jgi:anti-sigma factor RsiW
MACDTWLEKLDAYLDGELPAADLKAFDAHLRTCSSCAAEGLARVQLKRAVKDAGRRFTPALEFRRQVQQKIAAKPRLMWNFRWALATAAVALVLVLAAGLTSVYSGRQRRQQQVYGELADLHVATLASTNPVDVVSSDRHTVKPWFEGKIPFTFNLPELQNSDFSLVGGRVTYLGQVPGAHLIYRIRKHQVSVFIFPAQLMAESLPAGVPNNLSFHAESWTQDGLRYFVIGDVGLDDIRVLEAQLKSAARS